MDNPQITHNTRLGRHDMAVQAYVETGGIRLDLNGLAGAASDLRIQLDGDDAARLIGILRAALADLEA